LSTSQLADHWSQPEKQKHHEKHPNTEKTLKEASMIMKNLIHDEIKKSSQIQPTLHCASLKINEYLKNINSLLLDFLNHHTRTRNF